MLNLSSKQLLKMWIILLPVLKNVDGSTNSKYSQCYIRSDKEGWRPFYSIVLVLVCGVLEQCLLFFYHCSDLPSEGRSSVTSIGGISQFLTDFFLHFLWESVFECLCKVPARTLIKKCNVIIWRDKIIMKAIYISIFPTYFSCCIWFPIEILLLICRKIKVCCCFFSSIVEMLWNYRYGNLNSQPQGEMPIRGV